MPYKKEIARKSKSVISENLRSYLLTGALVQNAEVFQLSGDHKSLGLVWKAVEKEILKEFIKANPCRRPYGFWACASDRRKKISGSGGWGPGVAIDLDGLPKYWQPDWNKKNPSVFESQAAYLERLDLLTRAEKLYLKKHKNLLKSEEVVFDE